MSLKVNLYEQMAKQDIRTIKNLSEETGISRKSLSKIMNKEVNGLNLDTIDRLCKTLKCDVNDLIIHDKDKVM